jgi:hypothetical protein
MSCPDFKEGLEAVLLMGANAGPPGSLLPGRVCRVVLENGRDPEVFRAKRGWSEIC